MHLDVGRHFMPLADLFRFVDLIALHKYNVFHLHLTDDQGWRFASTRTRGCRSWRAGGARPSGTCRTSPTAPRTAGSTPTTSSGRWSAYAADRGVTVMPELEFPGHVLALLAAYPELGNHPETGYETGHHVRRLPRGPQPVRRDAMAVVFDLYAELLEVFDSPYVHVGGDECPPDEWLASPAARALAEQRGLPGPEYLQRWFTEQLRDWLAARDRRLVGWDEINDEGPLEGAVAMAWRDASYGIRGRAGRDGRGDVAGHPHLFDYYPSDGRRRGVRDRRPPTARAGVRLRTAGRPARGGAPQGPRHPVPGVAGVHADTRRVDYLLFPRAAPTPRWPGRPRRAVLGGVRGPAGPPTWNGWPRSASSSGRRPVRFPGSRAGPARSADRPNTAVPWPDRDDRAIVRVE